MSNTGWSNKPSYEDLKRDYDASKAGHDRALDRIKKYKDIYEEEGSLSIPYTQDRSSYKSKLVRKQLEWAIPNIEEPILSTQSLFTLTPLNAEAIDDTRKNKSILDYQWNNQVDKVSFINRATRKFAIEGTCVIKCGWKVKTKEVTKMVMEPVFAETQEEVMSIIDRVSQNDPNMAEQMIAKAQAGEQIQIGERETEVTETIVVENRPRFEVRDNESIYIDPTAKGKPENVRFIIDVTETDYSTIVDNESFENLDYIREYILDQNDNGLSEHDITVGKYSEEHFRFSDLARKKVMMHEYWGLWDIDGSGNLESIVACWIGEKIVRLEKNPFPHKRIPYTFATFMPIDNDNYGQANAELLWREQLSLSGTVRAMQDITNESAIGQEFIDESLFADGTQKDNYEKGKRVYTKSGLAINDLFHRKSVEPVPNVLFDLKEMYSNTATKMTGVRDMQRQEERNPRSKGMSDGNADGESDREMSILRRFSRMIEQLGSMTLSNNREFLLPDQIFGTKETYEAIKDVESLSDEFKVSVEVSTPTVKNRQASRLMTMMQTNSANMNPKISSLHYIKIADLWGFKDLSDALTEEMNQPPSEEDQKMQQLQLQDAELSVRLKQMQIMSVVKDMEHKDAKVAEIMTAISAGNAEAEVLKDKASAELYLAQADKMGSQKQLFDQEFGLIDDGTIRTQKKQDHEYQHLANLEREDKRTQREQDSIKQKEESKKDGKSTKEENLDYIKNGTMFNESYDAADDVFRNILDKNSLDTDKYTKQTKPTKTKDK